MNITLSQKDADFILKFLRADLERVSSSNVEIKEKQIEFKKEISELNLQSDSCPEMILVKNLLDLSSDMLNESLDIEKDLCRCIELLMMGSKDCD